MIRLAVLAVLAAAAFTVTQFVRWKRELESGRSPALSEAPTSAELVLENPRPVPEFELVDQRGRTIRLRDLLGHVWVADFIFTSCTGPCPAMSARMQAVQRDVARDPELKDRVRLVSFSVDPDRDTPEKLLAYARALGANPDLWLFLTGPAGAVHALSERGFALPAGPEPPRADGPAAPGFFHSERFALVDAAGRIRSYIDRRPDREHMEVLLRRLRALAAESRAVEEP